MMICHHRSASKHPPDFRELFSSYIEAPNTFLKKKKFDFKTACEKRFFTIGLVRALKMSFYGAHYRTEMSILGLPVSLSASEDEKHDHTQLFT